MFKKANRNFSTLTNNTTVLLFWNGEDRFPRKSKIYCHNLF